MAKKKIDPIIAIEQKISSIEGNQDYSHSSNDELQDLYNEYERILLNAGYEDGVPGRSLELEKLRKWSKKMKKKNSKKK